MWTGGSATPACVYPWFPACPQLLYCETLMYCHCNFIGLLARVNPKTQNYQICCTHPCRNLIGLLPLRFFLTQEQTALHQSTLPYYAVAHCLLQSLTFTMIYAISHNGPPLRFKFRQ